MSEIPRAVLSEHLQDRMQGRRLVAAVFLTYQFDPAFFEQEILPVFLDVSLSHAPPIKLVQLEEALRSVPDGIAVYYDQNGLIAETGGAKLDIRRIPVRQRSGIFHAKNIFLLVEAAEPDDDGYRERSLLVSCLSANLTRSAWWENVEACHTEEIEEGGFTRLGDDLFSFLEGLERRTADRSTDGSASLRAIRGFLRGTDVRSKRTTDGKLHPHFYAGRGSIPDFLWDVAGKTLQGMYLEIISPFFDESAESRPLEELRNRFDPREVRVFLPRKDTGDALCAQEMFESISALPGVSWGRLPKDLLRRGKAEDACPRFVHAKVYRFFQKQPARELLFVGSANLTSAAHSSGGNLETGFLVEVDPPRRPDWWLEEDRSRPRTFESRAEDDETATSGGTRLSLRYWWDRKQAEVYWDDVTASPMLRLESQGVPVVTLDAVPSRTWTLLEASVTAALEQLLRSTSILEVHGDGPQPGLLLVQEESMSHRPSVLFDLSPAEILRYWSLLTVEQRVAFIESRAPQLAQTGEGAALISRFERLMEQDTLFDRFAGIFHAFGCLERGVRGSLADGKEKDAIYRLFGQKYDSLGSLLDRIRTEDAEGKGDPIEHYVIGLCARQLLETLKEEHPEFWERHADDERRVGEQLAAVTGLRAKIAEKDPERMPEFLDWFEKWFLRRAEPVAVETP